MDVQYRYMKYTLLESFTEQHRSIKSTGKGTFDIQNVIPLRVYGPYKMAKVYGPCNIILHGPYY